MRTEHVFELTKKRSKAWAVLKLFSSAGSSKSLPTFVEGDKITGSLSLDLDQDSICSVDIYVQGRIFSGAAEGQVFLDQSLTLWSREMGDPRNSSTGPESRFEGKLSGAFQWPFSISLPKEVIVSTMLTRSGSRTATYRLPVTLLERNGRANIHYDLIVNIARSKFRPDSKIQTMFVYIPATRPDPPSRLRQLAYQENSPILGPEADPDGWRTAPPVKVQGTVFSIRDVEILCRLSFAKPLCYTRGSVIPLSLSLSSTDTQVLDLLSAKAITVRLKRVLKFRVKTAGPDENLYGQWSLEMKDDVEEMTSAVWWPSAEGAQTNLNERQFSGEIQLAKGLKPSCAISHLKLFYIVVFLPFEATGFTSANNGPLLEQTVEVATLYAKGPRPITYSPPNYATV